MLALIALAACPSAGCGRSWLDPFEREPELESRECAGLLWAASGDADLVLVDVERQSAERFATLPVGTWALGTAPDGTLSLWEAVSANPRLFTFDPWTGDAEVVHAVQTEDNMDRGGYGPDGTFWAIAVPSQTMLAYDRRSGSLSTASLAGVGAGQGGDLAAVGDAIAIVWWPDRIGVVAGPSEAPVSTELELGLGDVQLSGIAVTDDRIWVATHDGQFFDLGRTSAIATPRVQRTFATDVELSDLAPVLARGSCPDRSGV